MFKKLLFFTALSLSVAGSTYAQASNKVLSPMTDWTLNVNPDTSKGRQCALTASYENNVEFLIESSQGRVKTIVISDPSANFGSADNVVDMAVMPRSFVRLEGSILNGQAIAIDVSSINDIFQQLRAGLILNAQLSDSSYNLSLTGLKNNIRKLQNCQTLKTTHPLNTVSFEDGMMDDTSRATGQPLNLSAFPLEPEIDEKPKQADVTSSAKIESEPLDEFQDVQMAKVDVQEEMNQSITKVHTPRTKISPSMSQVELLSEDNLKKPPKFELQNVPETSKEYSHLETRTIASINDDSASIFFEDDFSPVKPSLSQTAEQAKTDPVIVPRIDTSSMETRFDITNQNVASKARQVSNQELETQMKVDEPMLASINEAENVMEQPLSPLPMTNVAVASDAWNAQAGQNLREVIANWSIDEGVELIWDTTEQFDVLNDLSVSESYENAIALILAQFMTQGYDKRPIGQLFIDPQSGDKMLIVQNN